MSTESNTPEPRKLVHVARIALRWRDMDVNRHINNVEYFRFMEQARIEWFHSALQARPDNFHGIVVANAYCNFSKEMLYPGNIDVCLSVGPPGRSSFTFYYEIYPENERATRYADGYSRAVYVDRRTGRSVLLPEYLRKLLA